MRERIAIFFNYVFPLIFFFGFGQALGAGRGGAVTQVVTMVLVIGILGNGLFGGGIRAVQDREQNILRRYKVAPISPLPLLVASIATGWALYLPAVVLTVGLARVVYGMPLPHAWFSLLVLVSVGVIAFRAVGLIIAAVANSAQESQILVQLVYLPMLFLTGATIPLAMLPAWAQQVAQFLPGTHLVTGLNGVMMRGESALEHWQPLLCCSLRPSWPLSFPCSSSGGRRARSCARGEAVARGGGGSVASAGRLSDCHTAADREDSRALPRHDAEPERTRAQRSHLRGRRRLRRKRGDPIGLGAYAIRPDRFCRRRCGPGCARRICGRD